MNRRDFIISLSALAGMAVAPGALALAHARDSGTKTPSPYRVRVVGLVPGSTVALLTCDPDAKQRGTCQIVAVTEDCDEEFEAEFPEDLYDQGWEVLVRVQGPFLLPFEVRNIHFVKGEAIVATTNVIDAICITAAEREGMAAKNAAHRKTWGLT